MADDVTPGGSRYVPPSSYAVEQLRRAMRTAIEHDDPSTRRRAETKALAWEAVLDGIASGRVDVGNRTPVEGTPAWVTLEVVRGGFATGRYVAEEPLDDDERELLAAAGPADADVPARLALNNWFLGDDGLSLLVEALRTRDYVIGVPEHGALLVVAWLLTHGHETSALDLVAELHPLLHRLRFTPALRPVPPGGGALVRRETVADTRRALAAVEVPPAVRSMNATLRTWNPLYDRLVALWSSTMVDGWPCRTWPDDWTDRREALLVDHHAALVAEGPTGRHHRPRSTYRVLLRALERCAHDSRDLDGREVGAIRAAVERSMARWGAPGSDGRTAVRETQRAVAARPTHAALAAGLMERLAGFPADVGIADLGPILEPFPLDGDEVVVPAGIERKVERALEAPIEELIRVGVVGSGEVLAGVVPQLTAALAAAAIDDDELRDLYARIYAAFRRRRSLLLLNLEKQVQLDELPWVRAIEVFRSPSASDRRAAADSLRDTTLLALSSFPQTILPNPLLSELQALSSAAEIEVPLVEEVAADIFTGRFTRKWRRAAVLTSETLDGSLYARYFDLPMPTSWATPARRRPWRTGPEVDVDFGDLCERRAAEAAVGDGSYVARNGTVIEQSQILTSQNLAPLVGVLDLRSRLEPQARALADRTFEWIVREQLTPRRGWTPHLRMLKNTAYAWRQAIFFLSLVDAGEQRRAVARLHDLVAASPADWRRRFEPAVAGLAAVVEGGRFELGGRLPGGRRFLGWSVGPHWLSPSERDPGRP